MDPRALPWPTAAAVLPVAPLRPVLERLASLARTHEQDVTLLPGLAAWDEETGQEGSAGDPPPALMQVVDELGGIALRGGADLDLLVAQRSDEGPYTLLGAPITFYPLHEGADAAVVLTVDDDGAPGAVYGIGEDLALRLAAPDLGSYLVRYADALEASLAALDAGTAAGDIPEDGAVRDEAAHALMDEHLFDALLGTGAAEDLEPRTMTAVVPGAEDAPGADDAPSAEAAPGSESTPASSAPTDVELPAGAVAVADLRDAEPGTALDIIDAPVDGDPLDLRLAWRAAGLVVALTPRG